MLPADEQMLRRRALVSAAVRAGYAWTCRFEQLAAWREVARMTGVVMSICGPGQGPNTPDTLIAALAHPLRDLHPQLFAEDPVGELSVLENGELTSAVYTYGCEHIVELLGKAGGLDPGRKWIPSWAWMQAELVENEAFQRIYDGASEAEYTAHRRFVVEHPAGQLKKLTDEFNAKVGSRRSVDYEPFEADQVFEGRYWWPCPVCRWPMHVSGPEVQCQFIPHNAVYYVRRDGDQPRLQRRDGHVPRQPRTRRYRAEGELRSIRVQTSVWRHIVIPGLTEIALYEHLKKKERQGLEASLWPGKDTVDVGVRILATRWSKDFDVKDFSSAAVLADALRAKPPAARTIVIPDYRGEAQRDELRDLLPNLEVLLERQARAQVAAQLRRAKRA
ncbi:hypothetical protein GCM10029978_045460 [Actinoallomurus acanthiterrae]